MVQAPGIRGSAAAALTEGNTGHDGHRPPVRTDVGREERPVSGTPPDSGTAERVLLILDNCEHVVAATAPLAAEIFRAAPQVHILATSRDIRLDARRRPAPPDDARGAAVGTRAARP